MSRKEKAETSEVRQALLEAPIRFPGCWLRKVNVGSRGSVRFGEAGWPDLWGYTNIGVAMFVEVKTATGKIAEEQFAFMCAALAAGCVCRFVIGGEWLEVDQIEGRHLKKIETRSKLRKGETNAQTTIR